MQTGYLARSARTGSRDRIVAMRFVELTGTKGDDDRITRMIDRPAASFDPTPRDQVVDRDGQVNLPNGGAGIARELAATLHARGNATRVAISHARGAVWPRLRYGAICAR